MAGHACHSVAVRASLTVLGNNVALHSMALQSGFSFAGGRENKNKNCVIVKNMSVSS
jgi:catalase (peroxidase I)